MEKHMLTVADAAKAAGISRSLLYDLWKNGEGPRTVRIGRRRLVPAEAAREWLNGLNSQAA